MKVRCDPPAYACVAIIFHSLGKLSFFLAAPAVVYLMLQYVLNPIFSHREDEEGKEDIAISIHSFFMLYQLCQDAVALLLVSPQPLVTLESPAPASASLSVCVYTFACAVLVVQLCSACDV